jgi:hypothetical protein
MIAFHFQFSDQAAWKCDRCLASGLTKTRRCAWLKANEQAPGRPVFARRRTVSFQCPKSIITAQSLTFIEQFLYWKRCGGDLWSLNAKSADAILALQEESAKENEDEE